MNNFWKSARRWLPGVIISLIAIAFLLPRLTCASCSRRSVRRTTGTCCAGLGISIIWLGVRGLLWRTLLQNKASYRDVFLTVSEGYLLNNLLPFRLGEFGRAFLVGPQIGPGFHGCPAEHRGRTRPGLCVCRLPADHFRPVRGGSYQHRYLGHPHRWSDGAGSGLLMYLLARNRAWALGTFDRLTGRWPRLQKQGDIFLTLFSTGLPS